MVLQPISRPALLPVSALRTRTNCHHNISLSHSPTLPFYQLDILFFLRADGTQALWGGVIVNALLMVFAKRMRVDGAAHLGGMFVGWVAYGLQGGRPVQPRPRATQVYSLPPSLPPPRSTSV